MKPAIQTRYLTVLLVLFAIITSFCNVPVFAGEIRCYGDGFELYSYTDYKNSGQKHIKSRQDVLDIFKPANVQVWGEVLTEPNYCYVYFRVKLDDSKVLYIPHGERNFVVHTVDGDYYDCGSFIHRGNKSSGITSQSTIGETPENLFVNPDRVMVNDKGEPRLIIRFPQELKLDKIISMEVSGRVQTISRR